MCADGIMNSLHRNEHLAMPVCEITFEKWVDTLSGHDKFCMDIDTGHSAKILVILSISNSF